MTKELKDIEIADNVVSRGLGLIGRGGWKRNGMLLKDTNAIHTVFVRFPIDVIFLDKDFKILRVVENMEPFRFSPIVWNAKHVLELPTGTIKNKSLRVGNKIKLV